MSVPATRSTTVMKFIAQLAQVLALDAQPLEGAVEGRIG
jgi:hypothetical protein